MITYTLKVITVNKESNDAVTICFKQPTLRKIVYVPGQYLTVNIIINNRKYKRPYSLSSTPGVDNTLNITVKRLPLGIVSNHLIDIVKEGDLLEVMEPMGDFIFKNDINKDTDVFLWGAGSGITPLMSILKTILNFSSQKITLLYCNKNLEETIFYNQLLALEKKYENRFSLYLFFTATHVPGARYGRISAEAIRDILKDLIDVKETIHYICGPLGLKEIVKTTLFDIGLAKSRIFSEDFEKNVDESELQEIQTRFIGILKKDKRINIEVIRGKSILEAGLDSRIDLPYSCQTGSCTLCKARLVSGEVKKINIEMPNIKLAKNERLLCCSYPLTDNVIFEVD